MAPSAVPINFANYDPPSVAVSPACTISEKCRKQVTAAQPCDIRDFDCITGQDPSFKNNTYFDSHCLFVECIYPEYRKAFVKAFLAACARRNVQATKFPEEWAVYLPTGLQISTQQPTSTATPSASTVSMTASSTFKPTTVNIFGPISATSSSLTTTMTSSATETANMTQAFSTNWADLQIPICGITQNCLVNQYTNNACDLDKLVCVCNISNSIGQSSYFKPACLFDACYNELGRREWMDAFAYACSTIPKDLADITPQWEPYIPQWYLDAKKPSSSPAPTSTTGGTNKSQTDLSEGAIAGISVAAVAAAIILAIIGLVIWRKDQKLKRKSKEVAQMADAMQPGGVQQRIDQLRYGGTSSSEGETRPGGGPQKEYYAHEGSLSNRHENGSYQDQDLQPAPLFHLPSPHSRPSREHEAATPYLRDSLDTPDPYTQPQPQSASPPQHYQPYPYERNASINRRVSHRSIVDSLGTTAVTTSPVQQYSVEHDARSSSDKDRARLRERPSLYDEHGKKVVWG